MAESKNIFIKSKMNKDLDDRLLQQGEYRNAVNIQVSKSESEDVGALENVLGNVQKFLTGNTTEKIIGYCVSEERSSVFLFLTTNSLANNPAGEYSVALSNNATHRIVEAVWNGNTFSSTTDLIGGTTGSASSFINFWEGAPIIGVNLLENLLFFTDNKNQPRKINVDTAISQGVGYYNTEDSISVAKFTPYTAPILWQQTETIDPNTGQTYQGYETTMKDVVSQYLPQSLPQSQQDNPYYNPTFQGDPDYLEDKFVRFGYRFKYDDGEYSVFSPFTQEAFIPQQDGYFLFNPSGTEDDDNDQSATYRSTVVDFMENKVNEITLRIPMPSVEDPSLPATTLANVTSQFKITEIEILYKESDEIRVLVADTLTANDIQAQYTPFFISNVGSGYSINSDVATTTNGSGNGLQVDIQAVSNTGEITSLIISTDGSGYAEGDVVTITGGGGNATLTIKELNTLEYVYSGTKPFKTLPEAQTVRVFDKVPVKAFAQEVVSNRVVYGNFQTQHTPPLDINYNTGAAAKRPFNNTGSSQNPTNPTLWSTSIVEYPSSTLKQNRNYQAGFVFADRFGRATSVILSNSGDASGGSASQFSTVFSPYNDSGVNVGDWPGDTLLVQLNTEIPTSPNASSLYPGVYNGNPSDPNYNPLGFFSWKIVVKQQEQDYYNVYLPGILNSYPLDNTLEVGLTSHIALLNDNINKIPRDLTEVGPEQKQFRSSVELFGRVQNTDVVANGTSGVSLSTNFGALNEQYFPSRFADTVSTIASEFDLFDVAPNQTNFPAQLNFSFYEAESNPLIGRISTTNPIGQIEDSSNPNPTYSIQNLAVYETKPTESRLDIYWETSTSGKITDLNEEVAQQSGATIFDIDDFDFLFNESFGVWQGSQPTSYNQPAAFTANPELVQPYGEAIVTGDFYFVTAANIPITNINITNFNVVNGNNVDVTNQFILMKIQVNQTYTKFDGTVAGPYTEDRFIVVNNTYKNYIADPLLQPERIYTFSITAEDVTPNTPAVGILRTFNLNPSTGLENTPTTIETVIPAQIVVSYGYSVTANGMAGQTRFTATNGANNDGTTTNPQYANRQNGITWSIVSQTDASGNAVNAFKVDPGAAPPTSNSDGVILENTYGQNSGRFIVTLRATGSDGTFSQATFDLIIGEETAGGSFEDGTTYYGNLAGSPNGVPGEYRVGFGFAGAENGVGYIASFHNNSTDFATDSSLAQQSQGNNGGLKPNSGTGTNDVGWGTSVTEANTSCYSPISQGGSPTNPQNFTSNFTVKGPSGGYGLPQGTGYVRVDMVFPALNPSNFQNVAQQIDQIFSVEYRNPNGAGYPNNWDRARDIEGTNLSSETFNGQTLANFLSNGDGVTAYPGNFSSNQEERIRYGCLSNIGSGVVPNNAVGVYLQNGNSIQNNNDAYFSRWFVIGNSPYYNAGTGAGEYRLVAGLLSTRGSVMPNPTTYGVRCFNNQGTFLGVNMLISISAGDFYYGFGNNRAFAYKVNTNNFGSRSAAESVSVLSTNQLVYAREPLPRYVTTFYQDISLTTPYNFGTSTGPVYLAYRASDTAPSGSSFVGNATQGSTSTNLQIAQAAEFAAGDTNVSQSTTQDRRIWTGYFQLNGSNGAVKIAGQSEPKKA